MSQPVVGKRAGEPATSLPISPPAGAVDPIAWLAEIRTRIRLQPLDPRGALSLLNEAVHQCRAWFDTTASAWFYDRERDSLIRIAAATDSPTSAAPQDELPTARALSQQARATAIAATHISVCSPETKATGTECEPWLLGDGAVLEVPTAVGGELLGSVRLATPNTARSWHADELALLQELTATIAPALTAAQRRPQKSTEDVDRLANQLRHASRLEAVGQLAGGVAHDFNNILTAIRGFADMIGMQCEDDSQREMVEEIRRATGRGQDLTRQLLKFARRQVARVEPLELGAALADLLPMLDRLTDRGIELELEAADEVVIEADPAQLQEVLLGLVMNSRDALPDGGIIGIRIAACDHGTLGPCATISVRDNGCGIAPEDLPKVFDPFFTTKEIGKGTGLGLSTVYGIVSKAGGEVRVESHPGEGACFEVLWPTTSGSMRSQTAVPTAGRSRGERVLLVEDDPANLRMVTSALEQLGYAVATATSGEHALEVANEHPKFELLLTDVVMPGMGGRRLAAHLGSERPELRVVFMSGYTTDEILRHGIEQDTVHFLAKPFALDSLANVLREAFDSPPATAMATPL